MPDDSVTCNECARLKEALAQGRERADDFAALGLGPNVVETEDFKVNELQRELAKHQAATGHK